MPETIQDKPFLRALKCAYKLHKAGLTENEVVSYLIQVTVRASADPLPSASIPVQDIIPATFNFEPSLHGAVYWQAIQDRLMAAAK